MLRLSKKSEYALMAVLHLARVPEGDRAAVSAIAEARSLPRGLLAKVMQELKRRDLVESTKGVTGGYRLKRSLSEIAFLDVVRPFEESVGLTECLDPLRPPCDRLDCCTLRDPIQTLNGWFMSQLSALTMADFVRMGLPGCAALSAGPSAARPRLQLLSAGAPSADTL